jgi:hypothetical protein
MNTPVENVYAKGIITVGWIAGVCSFGLGSAAGLGGSWLALATVALLPPMVMLRLWSAPPLTMSESIARGRRQ